MEKALKLVSDLPLAIVNSSLTVDAIKPNLLLKFSENGQLNEIKKLFGSNELYYLKTSIEYSDENGQTCLIVAARKGYFEIVKFFVGIGADVNAYDYDNWSALLNAAKEGHLEIVKYLVENGANIECVDFGSFTPLMWACYKNRSKVVAYLLENGADSNATCKNSVSCLSWAAGRGYTDVVNELLKCEDISIESFDKHGNTPLIWAARKGTTDIVKALVNKGANADAVGMNNWTPLLISLRNGHVDTALYLLSIDNLNINQTDKDGNSSVTISAKRGYCSVLTELLEKGAYINVPNKKGDSILITAIKNGHKEVVNVLLNRHVDVDVIGSQGKTALHYAVERGSLDIVKGILACKPDVEIRTDEGDTALLLAARKKNANIVNELLSYGARLSVTDKIGDTALHIALRNRNRDITETILSNPRNSKYLYRPNKRGETPYKIDASNPKSILTQLFGARQLNMTEDSILGYDLYSSALAEILSEPSLHTPITVGLYAKWGSGKSFLLSQLKDEMKTFAKLTKLISFKIDIFTVISIIIFCFLFAYPFALWIWWVGLIVCFVLNLAAFIFIGVCKYNHNKERNEWSTRICESMSKYIKQFKLFLQVMFLNPNHNNSQNTIETNNLRFIFTEYGKISTLGGERALAQMVITLYDRIERECGFIVTRLCRVFNNKSHSNKKFHRMCCIPTFLFVIFAFVSLIAISIILRVDGFQFRAHDSALLGIFMTIILISLISTSITSFKMMWSLFKSPKRHINSSLRGMTNAKIEGFLLKLKFEIDSMSRTMRTIDAFTNTTTRLVIVIDGLDSCEQSKVLQILEIVHVLFTREGDPYITILAVDPHVLIKGIEGNLNATLGSRTSTLNGHEYLRAIIHLPIYLQIDLSKTKAISKMANNLPKKRANTITGSTQDIYSSKNIGELVNADLLKRGKRTKNGRNIFKAQPMSTYDITDQIIKSDYFLDVNPRNLRRIINIIALTGRLLRAYHIDFNWNTLALWIYLNEQWPYLCSWIVMEYEENEGEYTDETKLKDIYEKIKGTIQAVNSKLVVLDRNARKFELFLEAAQPSMTILHLKKFLPCTTNFDPYLIILIKDSMDDRHPIEQNFHRIPSMLNNIRIPENLNDLNITSPMLQVHQQHQSQQPQQQAFMQPSLLYTMNTPNPSDHNSYTLLSNQTTSSTNPMGKSFALYEQPTDLHTHTIDMSKVLSNMTLNDVVESLHSIDGLQIHFIEVYAEVLREKNINGKVLQLCDVNELKVELNMTFGDWQLFKNWILNQRQLAVSRQNTQQHANRSLLKPVQHQQANAQPLSVPSSVLRKFSNTKVFNEQLTSSLSNDESDSKCPLLIKNTDENEPIVFFRNLEEQLLNEQQQQQQTKKVDFFLQHQIKVSTSSSEELEDVKQANPNRSGRIDESLIQCDNTDGIELKPLISQNNQENLDENDDKNFRERKTVRNISQSIDNLFFGNYRRLSKSGDK